jgi:hypothetical protein
MTPLAMPAVERARLASGELGGLGGIGAAGGTGKLGGTGKPGATGRMCEPDEPSSTDSVIEGRFLRVGV